MTSKLEADRDEIEGMKSPKRSMKSQVMTCLIPHK